MKIKIIDLLNKIANNEDVPKKIKWGDYELEWEELGYHDYKFLDTGNHLLFQGFATSVLNEDVEIIEEPKKIEKIARCDNIRMTHYGEIYQPTENQEILRIKINELIDAVNELKRDK